MAIFGKETSFPTSFDLAVVFKGYLYQGNLQKIGLFYIINETDVIRGRSRTLKTSKIEFYVKNVKSFNL